MQASRGEETGAIVLQHGTVWGIWTKCEYVLRFYKDWGSCRVTMCKITSRFLLRAQAEKMTSQSKAPEKRGVLSRKPPKPNFFSSVFTCVHFLRRLHIGQLNAVIMVALYG